ncbi:MAG TPA: DUF5335 family protein [Nodosilinea sp.]|nr:DUF5335 family protein [Nodosilinea sp.]
MQVQVSYKRYQLDIPPMVWPDFFDQLTDDNRGRLTTLKRLDAQLGDFEVLRSMPLHAITYRWADDGRDLVVTLGRPSGIDEVTYTHRIVFPRTVSIITDEDGVVLSCTVTTDDDAQTIIGFQL